MKQEHERHPLAAARLLARDLRLLREVSAPPTLALGALQRTGVVDAYISLETPLGPVFVAYNARGVSCVHRAPDAATFEADFARLFARGASAAITPDEALRRQIVEVLRGERRAQMRFDLRGLSEFERAVLLKALEIPRGEVRPYGWIAREIGRPGAARAVGTALKRNPIPLLIPCHRVVRSDGALGEYAMGGTSAKRIALAAESLDVALVESLAAAGVRYIGREETHTYCFPTCGGAEPLPAPHLVPFPSQRAAQAAGYHPCQDCRPA